MSEILTPAWDAEHLAVHRETLIDDDGQPELALLRHPNYPFRATVASEPAGLFGELVEVADAYLVRIDALGQAPWLPQRVADERAGFGWLPIGWDGPDGRLDDPRGSFGVCRRRPDGQALDCTVVLVAGERARLADGVRLVNGAQIGLRVVMHLDMRPGDIWRVRVTGLSTGGLRQLRAVSDAEVEAVQAQLLVLLQAATQLAPAAFDLDDGTPPVIGIRPSHGGGARVSGGGSRADAGASGGRRVYQWQLDLVPTADQGVFAIRSARLEQQRSDAWPGRLMHQDPASAGPADTLVARRPTRDEATLDQFRKATWLPATLRAPHFEVLQSQLADRENQPDNPQVIRPDNLPLRSDHLAAAHAFRRGDEFFRLLLDLGLRPEAYFRFARLPLRLRHRASFDARPNGKAVNAQVAPDASPMGFLQPYVPAQRPRLEVRFGAANLRHRHVRPNDKGRPTAQPLGLAADPRWAWHEFGHVLSYAATGALEFQFAHSAGDALAAVLADPRSRLAPDPDAPWRGETHPWVRTGRRHDRSATAGWCWCGRLNGMRHAPLQFPPLLYKGYAEEQMLSSSLFRLYRAVGGDTFGTARGCAPFATRQRAANSCAYLVMRAIALLGPAALVPARSADAFVSALVDADIGTRLPASPRRHHTGGCLHKVVRWAFEQQGLFATDVPTADVEGPGLPPAVDLWIRDRRGGLGGCVGDVDGGYWPVPLWWAPDAPWQADATVGQGLWVQGGRVHAVVRNRGGQAATQVAVRAWAAPDPALPGPLAWVALGEVGVAAIPGGDHCTVSIDPVIALPPTPYWLVVEASCTADRSNLDPDADLPCAGTEPPGSTARLLDLVAHDNNLGLCRVAASD